MCFIRSRQNYLSRYHAIISYFSRLPSRKIKTFPVPWVYLIPFPAILKPNFPISRLKKWQILRPEKALLGPFSECLLFLLLTFICLDIRCNRQKYSLAESFTPVYFLIGQNYSPSSFVVGNKFSL